MIRQDPTDGTRVLELQLTENAQRADLTPLDQARAFRAMMDHHRWTTRDLAGFLHLHHSIVARAVRLLTLPEPVRDHVISGAIAPSVAAEIARLPDEGAQHYLAEQVIRKGMTRLDVVEAVHQFSGKPRGSARLAPDRRRPPVDRSLHGEAPSRARAVSPAWKLPMAMQPQRSGWREYFHNLRE